MKTITWDKFIALINDANIFVTVDGVAADINYFPSQEMVTIFYENKRDSCDFNIKRSDNENIEVGESCANIKCVDEQGMMENCRFKFLIPKELF